MSPLPDPAAALKQLRALFGFPSSAAMDQALLDLYTHNDGRDPPQAIVLNLSPRRSHGDALQRLQAYLHRDVRPAHVVYDEAAEFVLVGGPTARLPQLLELHDARNAAHRVNPSTLRAFRQCGKSEMTFSRYLGSLDRWSHLMNRYGQGTTLDSYWAVFHVLYTVRPIR